MPQKWVRPRITDINALPTALGDCRNGETEFTTSCENGGSTCALTTLPCEPHYCGNGGYASFQSGGCNSGFQVEDFIGNCQGGGTPLT